MDYRSELTQAYAHVAEHNTGIPQATPDVVTKALNLACRAHEGQLRRSGAPYVSHPVAVAVELIESGWDATTVAAGLCHDVVEDCDVTRDQLAQVLGEDVAMLVDGVTRLGQVRGRDLDKAQAANMAKLVGFIAGDVRVLAVKLADRLHNMRTLGYLAQEKQVRIAKETLEIFAPLAKRIGAEQWSGELEDLGFRWSMANEWDELDEDLKRVAPTRRELEDYASDTTAKALANAGINATISSRTKGRWSLWQKLQRDGRSLLDVSDLVGLRIIVDDEMSCYGALGVIHKNFIPVPDRFKDYIAIPKKNGYQSLHTTVVDNQGRHFEVQIRTPSMHSQALWGNAAHHAYKMGEDLIGTDPALNAEQFLEELKNELSQQQEILVLTPKGRVVTLPAGSCGIDFAYHVHTEVGNRCVGVRVNGALRPIRGVLHTGDVVEVITRNDAVPKRDWLETVQTSAARNRIRRYFAQQDRSINERRGKETVDRALRERKIENEPTDSDAQKLDCLTVSDLYVKIGEGSMAVSKITNLLNPTPLVGRPKKVTKKAGNLHSNSSTVSVPELEGLRFQIAQCCKPEESDEMIGYVTAGRGVSVHRSDCFNVQNMKENLEESQQGRLLKLARQKGWEIEIIAADRPGLLADVATVFADAGIDITSSATTTRRQKVTERFQCQITEDTGVEDLVGKLKNVASIVTVTSRRL